VIGKVSIFFLLLLPAESLKRISLGEYDGSAWYFSLVYRERDECRINSYTETWW